MAYRLTEPAEDQLDRIILESADRFGIEAAVRYNRLFLAVAAALGGDPLLLGSSTITRMPGIRSYPLRAGRSLVPVEHRVRSPRHLVIYQLASDGVVEILGLAHDRQSLSRAAARAVRDARRS